MIEKDKIKILLVDDEALIRMGFRQHLKKLGYAVIGEARNGEEAISLVETLQPNLLLMDIKMPVLDGIQALEKINANRSPMLPCIFVTAFTDDQLIGRANDAGAFGYLVKPVTPEGLKATIAVALERYAAYIEVCKQRDDSKGALEDRKYIERAKGYLMDNFSMKEKDALQFLQKKSRATNKKLVEVAKSILAIEGNVC